MASPEVERPMTSPAHHHHHPGGYARPTPRLSNSGDKRKMLHFRYNKNKFAASNQTNNASRRNSSGSNSSAVNVRKRSYSFTEGHVKSVTSVTPAKRWKKHSSKEAASKKFLLGGNIRDPLNLNSLSDEKVSRVVNAVTPESSPIPTPKHRKAEYKIEVFIPPNISDPLNLMQDDNDDDYDASFNKKKPRHRKRYHNRKVEPESPKEVKKVRFDASISDCRVDEHASKQDEMPSSAPQASDDQSRKKTAVKPSKKSLKSKLKFQFGNYARYYGYRLEGSDPRLQYFDMDWFRGKDVLDIGCNVGEVTMVIARDMGPKSILGIDIDPLLIEKARKTVSQYANRKVPSAMATPNPDMSSSEPSSQKEQLFPQSLPMIFGPLDPTSSIASNATSCHQQLPAQVLLNPSLFPHNIKFLCDNYVLEDDDLLEFAQPEFDAILCLSTTKWIHLNFGDDGLKRAFKRMFAQLKPQGVLILEPQSYASYSKKARKLNATTREHFTGMKLMPNQFVEYLVKEVGFTGGDIVATPEHSAAGFRRPIHVFKKPSSSSSS